MKTLQFKEIKVGPQQIAPDEVEIEVKATGVSLKDVMAALDQIPANTLGLECFGIISCAGAAVLKLQVGDCVCAFAIGAYQTKLLVHAAAVSKIPEEISFSTAAACPSSFCITYYALFHIARLQEGNSVLT